MSAAARFELSCRRCSVFEQGEQARGGDREEDDEQRARTVAPNGRPRMKIPPTKYARTPVTGKMYHVRRTEYDFGTQMHAPQREHGNGYPTYSTSSPGDSAAMLTIGTASGRLRGALFW